jgi:HxlR-like helix-turn-helix
MGKPARRAPSLLPSSPPGLPARPVQRCWPQKRVHYWVAASAWLCDHSHNHAPAGRSATVTIFHSASSRQAYPVVPPRVDYSLTDRGRELADLLLPLVDWVTANAANGSA